MTWLLLCILAPWSFAEPYSVDDCQPFQLADQRNNEKAVYADALLWEISNSAGKPSYLFGTIHVSDPEVVALPDKVAQKLDMADVFVMEALPLIDETAALTNMMFFNDGQSLTNYLDQDLFKKAVDILGKYQMSIELVTLLKPWAAFLIMNYPPSEGLPLDLQLLDRASQQGIKSGALETLTEQGNLFSDMDIDDQMQLLMDTLCNYHLVVEEFETMKSYYLERNLQGLIDTSYKYTITDDAVYQTLMEKLLFDRNLTMVKRMEYFLHDGNAFIAIGALHLPGEDGVLSLLHEKGYTIKKIY